MGFKVDRGLSDNPAVSPENSLPYRFMSLVGGGLEWMDLGLFAAWLLFF